MFKCKYLRLHRVEMGHIKHMKATFNVCWCKSSGLGILLEFWHNVVVKGTTPKTYAQMFLHTPT